ncbi:MAG: universal stress protein [Terrabacter sp.]|nr:universal stress protein [Dermatophilaceae bacterium]NUO92827.1 universal stress protein [Dermatophilaceae bacterium]NUR16145.1 universal stress protein [Dermatophilaceae bacterium]NUR81117.1 universal stress protein [Dermatophilaceae bacterium]NUS40638.1 universal stress protein [Terrabacter sp.]
MFSKIVVGYIPTPEGVAALDAAISLARPERSHVTVVNTGRDGNYADKSFAVAEDIDTIDLQLANADIPHDVRQPTSGRSAADEILGAATEVGADLVVIGLRRRSPVGKLMTGSTAQQVLLDAPCAVLTVKAR